MHRRPFSIALALGLFVIHAASPPTVRSMVTITYAFALFLVPWLALREQPAPLRWLASLVAILAMWLLPVRSGTEAAAASAAIAFLAWLALRNDEMADGEAASVRRAFAAGAVVAFALPALTLGARAATSVLKAVDAHPEWTKAQRLLSDVTPAGSRIAVLGNPDDAGWARLARYQIVGAVPPDEVDAFQNLSDGDRARIMRAFSRVGATRLIAP